jgi:hypothetical protein
MTPSARLRPSSIRACYIFRLVLATLQFSYCPTRSVVVGCSHCPMADTPRVGGRPSQRDNRHGVHTHLRAGTKSAMWVALCSQINVGLPGFAEDSVLAAFSLPTR